MKYTNWKSAAAAARNRALNLYEIRNGQARYQGNKDLPVQIAYLKGEENSRIHHQYLDEQGNLCVHWKKYDNAWDIALASPQEYPLRVITSCDDAPVKKFRTEKIGGTYRGSGRFRVPYIAYGAGVEDVGDHVLVSVTPSEVCEGGYLTVYRPV